MRRESVSELTGVCSQIKSHLLQLVHHHPSGSLVAAKLAVGKLLPLADAADDGPHQQIRYINRHGLRKAGELGCKRTDSASVAAGVQGQDLETADFL